MLGVLVLAGLGLAASAQEALHPQPGWMRKPTALLYYDAQGQLAGEIGLGRWEDAGRARFNIKIMDGGACPNARFAWTLEKREIWNAPKTKLLESRGVLRFFDANGKELWSAEGPDFIPGGPPMVSSRDGQIWLLALRRADGWMVQVKAYLGNVLWETGPFARLEALQISPNGRYGAARWSEPDKASVHSFLDIPRQARQDVPSERFLLGKAEIDDQGEARAEQKVVFSFAAAAAGPPPSLKGGSSPFPKGAAAKP